MSNKVKIIVDSTCDMGIDQINELDFDVVKFVLTLKQKEYYDIDTTCRDILDLVEIEKELPKTVAVTAPILVDFFNKWLDQGYDVIYLGIGSNFSRSYSNSLDAKEECNKPENVYIVDTKSLSVGSGLIALKAYELKEKGLSAQKIKVILEMYTGKVRCQFVLKTLEFMRKGGRTSNFSSAIGQALRIKPVISIVDGKMGVYKKAIGKVTKGLDIILNDLLEEYKNNNLDLENAYVIHTYNDIGVKYIYDFLEKNNIKFKKVYERIAGSIVTSHCGEGTIGFVYSVINDNRK